MTDSRLQELKRAWEASGSVEDEAAYLRERVRVGDLTQERLELAAYCGHEGAGRATELVSKEPSQDLLAWIRGLNKWGSRKTLIALAHYVELHRRLLDNSDFEEDFTYLLRELLKTHAMAEEAIEALIVHAWECANWMSTDEELSIMLTLLRSLEFASSPCPESLDDVLESIERPHPSAREVVARGVLASTDLAF